MTHRRPWWRWTLGTLAAVLAGMIAVAILAGAWAGRIVTAGEVSSSPPASRVVPAPTPSAAVGPRLAAVLGRLDRARVDGRTALRRARTPAAQARAARRLADQHVATAEALGPMRGAASSSLIERLGSSGRAYAALAAAASDGSAGRFHSAQRDVRVAEAGLARAVDAVVEHGTRQATPGPSTARGAQADGPDPARPGLMQLLVVVLALLASGAAGFVSSGPVATAAGTVRRAGWRRGVGSPRVPNPGPRDTTQPAENH